MTEESADTDAREKDAQGTDAQGTDAALAFEALPVGRLQANCYLVRRGPDALVVDPGAEADRIVGRLDDRAVETVHAILLTHAHMDHVLGVKGVKEATGAPVWLHAADRPFYERAHDSSARFLGEAAEPQPAPDHELQPGPWSKGPFRCEVLATPGHTPGGVSFHFAGAGRVLVGDVLFAGGVGRTDFGGDVETLLRSIKEVLFDLPEETVVLPGHGPPTTLAVEARSNPFVT